jgi:hypothetical protein
MLPQGDGTKARQGGLVARLASGFDIEMVKAATGEAGNDVHRPQRHVRAAADWLHG